MILAEPSPHEMSWEELRAFDLGAWLAKDAVVWVFAPKPRRGEHSRKPPVVRDRIVELLGDRSRVELFAREESPGWNAWGDEL